MDITKELQENQTILVVVGNADYNSTIAQMAKQLSKKSLCYVTLNKTYQSLTELFKKKGVNLANTVFIDGITKTVRDAKNTEACYFTSSPGALTELSLAITKIADHRFNHIIFDSITNLLIYQKEAMVIRFISSIIAKTKARKETKLVLLALKTKENQQMIQQTGMFVDQVINL